MEGILTMSQKESDRLMVISQIETSKLTIEKGSELLGISQRQLYRIIKQLKQEGAKGVIHKLRGRQSNRGYPKQLKAEIIRIYQLNNGFLSELIRIVVWYRWGYLI